jgi:hypothetical protein
MSRDDVPRLHREPYREWTPDQASRHNRASNSEVHRISDEDKPARGRGVDTILTRERWT